MKRKLLVSLVFLALLVGIAVVGRMFLSSLNPSDRAYAEIPRIRLPALKPEAFAYVRDPVGLDNQPTQLLLVRRRDASLKVWRISTKDGIHLLPDIHWWREGAPCLRFEPNFQSGIIECIESEQGEWARQVYRWDLNGRNISGQVDDMWEIKGREDGDEFVFAPGR
jgi:hypothetical protein